MFKFGNKEKLPVRSKLLVSFRADIKLSDEMIVPLINEVMNNKDCIIKY